MIKKDWGHFDMIKKEWGNFDESKDKDFSPHKFWIVDIVDYELNIKGFKDLTLLQQPYIKWNYGGSHYEAYASDKDGNAYLIKWEIISDDPENERDENNMCHWDYPNNIIRL